MSLYSLATEIFTNIENARNEALWRKDERGGQLRDGELPRRDIKRQQDIKQIPTLELLEGCLAEIRCGARPVPVVEITSGRQPGKNIVHNRHPDLAVVNPLRFNETTNGQPGSSFTRVDERRGNQHGHAKGSVSAAGPESDTEAQRTIEWGVNQARTDQFWGDISLGTMTSSSAYGTMSRGGSLHSGVKRSKTDVVAAEVFASFELETEKWIRSAGVRASPRVWAEFAAHMSEKYLCGSLDTMPSSDIVCGLRRKAARRIDQLASREGLFPVGGEGRQVDSELARGRTFSPREISAKTSGAATKCGTLINYKVKKTKGAGPKLLERIGCPTNVISGNGNSKASCNKSDDFGEPCMRADGLDRGNVGTVRTCVGLSEQFPLLGENQSGRLLGIAREPRARVVRFLLKGDSGDEPSPMVRGKAKREVDVPTGKSRRKNKNTGVTDSKLGRYWVCGVCGKRNEAGREACIICGRREDDNCKISKMDNSSVASSRKNDAEMIRQDRQDADLRGCIRGSGWKRGVSGGTLEQATSKDATRCSHGGYCFSRFSKMRQATEPAVKERLNLTGEINSLLSTIRGGC